MKDDFTRDTFDPSKHFSRVLMQQGRVTLDADHNEQTDILLHLLRTLTRDLLGPYAAPSAEGGFKLTANGAALTISAGRMYVDGILVENDEDCDYTKQLDYPLPDNDPLATALLKTLTSNFWLYLDVWERNITWIEDDSIREKALNGPDTCARSKVVWQVKAISTDTLGQTTGTTDSIQKQLSVLKQELSQTDNEDEQEQIERQMQVLEQQLAGASPTQSVPTCDGPLSPLSGLSMASMTARLDPGQQIQDPCLTSPASQYRGAENQLYRVEVHTPGTAGTATFKWSRDNGSVATTWLGGSGNDFQVGATRGFASGSWVELGDDTLDLQGQPGTLVKLAKVDGGVLSVNSSTPASLTGWSDDYVNPRIRRWNQQASDAQQLVAGAIPITESLPSAPVWIDLEDGIQVMFAPGGTYRTGDYWLIPARVATGQIEWPSTPDSNNNPVPDALAPDGIEHHYAPLGFVNWSNGTLQFRACRCEFSPINSCFGKGSIAAGAQLLKTANTRATLSAEVQRTKRVSKAK
ncbi:FlxA-like family protein [Granulicella arctica]|uniref:FlxA-like family protein n=1 Tax=Granulicella arctica TaxID=940613 RepID=UPI0021DF4C4D|nr:FlxA-like family protein [Granulicella arctica]